MPVSSVSGLAARIVETLRAVVGERSGLHEPEFAGNEREYVLACLDSSYVSSIGPFVDKFERQLEAATGARHAIATVNGTAALHVALLLAGVRPGDEVIVPALTFAATAAAVVYCGATPHFADSEARTLGLDPRALAVHLRSVCSLRDGVAINRATGRPIRAVVPMHTFGHPVDIDALVGVASEFNLAIVEDAAESLGSLYRDRHTGTFGRLGVLSFNGNKIVTTGGGGAILTEDPQLAARARHLSTTAKLPHAWEYSHDEVGYNYRMPGVNAAIGCAQLEKLPAFIHAKRRLFEQYRDAFAGDTAVRVFAEPPGCRSNYWLQTLVLANSSVSERDEVLAATNAAGIATRPAWRLLHRLPPYGAAPRMALPVAEALESRIINVPSSARLGGGETA
jgi:perosamine synthetase